MSKITGREEIFKGLSLGDGVIGLINKSQTLIDQIHKYNKDVLAGNVRPIEVDANRRGIFWSSIEKGIYFGGLRRCRV